MLCSHILLMRSGDQRLIVESSANLRSCHNVEQATIINHDALYNFHRQWIEDLVTRAGRKKGSN